MQSPRQYDQISLSISSDEVGMFVVEATFLGVPSPDGAVEISMDELVGFFFTRLALYLTECRIASSSIQCQTDVELGWHGEM